MLALIMAFVLTVLVLSYFAAYAAREDEMRKAREKSEKESVRRIMAIRKAGRNRS